MDRYAPVARIRAFVDLEEHGLVAICQADKSGKKLLKADQHLPVVKELSDVSTNITKLAAVAQPILPQILPGTLAFGCKLRHGRCVSLSRHTFAKSKR